MICSILDGGRVRIYVTVRELLLLLLVLWMGGRSDRVGCAVAVGEREKVMLGERRENGKKGQG